MSLENKISLELYKAIIDGMPYGVLVANPNGEFILWNKLSYSLFKNDLAVSRQENWVHDWGVFEVDKKTMFKPDDVPLARALRGEVVTNVKIYIKNADKDKDGVFIKVNAYPIRSETGQLEAGIVIVEDITKEQLFYDKMIDTISEFQNSVEYLLTHN